MEKWINHYFTSSDRETAEFAMFARDLKRYVKKLLPKEFEITTWDKGHFEVSAFIRNTKTGKYAYIKCSDVRYFQDNWYREMLVRKAKDTKDYTGGANNFVRLNNIADSLHHLTV